jgi:hypothetical protein
MLFSFSALLDHTRISMSQHSNTSSSTPNPTSRSKGHGAYQPVADRNRSEANLSSTSNSRQDTNAAVSDPSPRYPLRSARQAQPQNVTTTTATSRPAAAVVHGVNLQSGLRASTARAQAQADYTLRVIQERVARNNGSTREALQAAGIIYDMARRAEDDEVELAQRRGWRRA